MKGFCFLLAMALLATGAPDTSAGEAKAVDRYGDPLPEGASGRLGTVRLRQRQGVLGVAFTPDGTAMASTGWGDSIRLWDLQSGKLIRRYRSTERRGTFGVAFSPDGRKMASVGEAGLVRLWEVSSGRELFKVGKNMGDRIFGVAFAPDGLIFATAGETVRLWDAATGDELLDLKPSDRVRDTHAVAFSPDGKILSSATGKTIHLWHLETGVPPTVIHDAHPERVVSLAFTPDGKKLISAGCRSERKTNMRVLNARPEIHVWDVASGKRLGQLESEHADHGECTMALSKDGRVLVSKHANGILVWDVPTGRVIRCIQAAPYRYGVRTHGLAISPSGKIVAARWRDHKVRLWDVSTGQPLFEQAECHSDAVISAQYSPDGKRLATGSEEGTVRLWDPASRKLVRALPPASGWVRQVLFSPDGKAIVAVGEARNDQKPGIVGAVRLFEAATGTLMRTIDLPDRGMAAALSPADFFALRGGARKVVSP